ncbi:MAG: hypothetical protein EOP87_05875 [Verrucomicrobiaceae bacterium]|nr:MAG: hypothetical protein EOP87_05875 [Verrucomicrobiaceae bacterium]
MVLVDGLAPAVIRWAEDQQRRILLEGRPLGPVELEFAGSLGIRHAEQVRVLEVERIPLPVPAFLVDLAEGCGLPVFAPGGMALGLGVYLLHGQEGSLPHELVHVAQYGRMGGIGAFMRTYLLQCLTEGYAGAELEREARLRSAGRNFTLHGKVYSI